MFFFFGGATGAGGHNRIDEMYEELLKNYRAGDHDIDIIGFSRGAAEAREFAYKIASEGIMRDKGLEACGLNWQLCS